MKRTICVCILLLMSVVFASGQNAASPQRPDAEVEKMIKEVSAESVEAYIRKLVSFGTRNTLSTQNDPKRGIGAARDWIFDEFSRISKDCGDCLTVEKQSFTQPANPPPRGRIPEPTVLTNVVATLKGTTDPDRIYVVSGHYDSMCTSPTNAECDAPGANDDASGTAAVIELARVMSKRRYDATIVFMAVPGEEQGLLGATYFAEQAKEKGWNIEGMITNDILGGVTTQKDSPHRNRVRVFSEGVPSDETEREAATRRSVGGENDSPSRQLARYIKEQSDRYLKDFKVWMIYRRDRYGRGGDHIPFLERGFAAVRFSEPDEDFTHQHQNVRTEDGKFYGDTPEYVDFGYVANGTRVNLIALASMANAPGKPKNVVIVTGRLTNDTELRWDANSDKDIAGYEIAYRDTSHPEWTHFIPAGNVTTFTVKNISKDNYFFGVRAVDKDGNRSPVVYPRPGR
ncbi:MAG: M20/M25/M40 family metallo-hydrolase [Acidobacteria bacterium]|nr:M20/M25/M40 family metallo-hydrolase [Acidobacteriota bacterium]